MRAIVTGYRLDSEKVKSWLRAEGRKQSYILSNLGISASLLGRMLGDGHLPQNINVVQDLAKLMNVHTSELIINREK